MKKFKILTCFSNQSIYRIARENLTNPPCIFVYLCICDMYLNVKKFNSEIQLNQYFCEFTVLPT